MKKIGNVWISLIHGHSDFSEGEYKIGIEYLGGCVKSLHILFGKHSLSLEWHSKAFRECSSQYPERTMFPRWSFPKKYYDLSALKRAFVIGGRRYVRTSHTFKVRIRYSYWWDDKNLYVSIGFYELFLEWQAKLSEKWYQKERMHYLKEMQARLRLQGFVEGASDYDEELAILLEQHDDLMAKPFDDRVKEIFKDFR